MTPEDIQKTTAVIESTDELGQVNDGLLAKDEEVESAPDCQIDEQSDAEAEDEDEDETDAEAGKKRVNFSQLVQKMRELLTTLPNPTENEICKTLNISHGKFCEVYSHLVARDKKYYEIQMPQRVRQTYLGSGGISISMEKIFEMGADEEFTIGKKIEIYYNNQDKTITLAAVEPTEDEIAKREEAKERRKAKCTTKESEEQKVSSDETEKQKVAAS